MSDPCVVLYVVPFFTTDERRKPRPFQKHASISPECIQLVCALSPVSHKGLHQGSLQSASQEACNKSTMFLFVFFNLKNVGETILQRTSKKSYSPLRHKQLSK